MLATLVWVWASLSCLNFVSSAQMEVLHSWTTVDFTFPSDEARSAMIRTRRFIPENVALIDVDVWEGLGTQKVFVTMPRFKEGTPATLATISPTGALAPYPDWSWHREGDCEGITSVFRVQVDRCGRLWVLDSGVIDIFTSEPKRICRPQILVFNLYNDRLAGVYQFPESVLDRDSLLATIAIDARGDKCLDTFAYIADVVAYKLIVFDANRQTSWRVASNYFYPYPLHGNFKINGANFDLMDGILGLAIGPLVNGDRRLYFHSLASVRESWVSTSVLRNSSIFLEGDGAPEAFHVSQYTRSSQSAAEAMSPSGVLFFGLLTENSIACWNSRLSYTRDNIITVARNNVSLQFASGLKVSGGRVWALTSRLQDFIVGRTVEGPTFRVAVGDVEVLTWGTKCQVKSIFNDSNLPSAPTHQRPSSGYKPLLFAN